MMAVAEFQVADLPCTNVTVYTDRAEVKRRIAVKLEKGTNEVLARGLANSADQDSVRVEGRGDATICEVLVQQKHVASTDSYTQQEAQLADQLIVLENDAKLLSNELAVVQQRGAVIDGVAKQIGSGNSENKERESRDFTSEAAMGDLDKFLVFYEDRVSTLMSRKMDLDARLVKVNEQVRVTRRNLEQLRVAGRRESMSKDVSIVLEASEAGEVQLDLSYLVSAASWSPSYDLRVSTTGEKKTMQVLYYGQIRQNSGEDWTDTRLSLSTATPAVGGKIPELKTLRVGFIPKPEAPTPVFKGRATGFGSAGGAMPQFAQMAAFSAPAEPMVERAVTQAREGVLSTSFEIARATSVPSDGAAHRVSVAVVDLTPTFVHETVPSRAPTAFLKAAAVNTSVYPLLVGPVAVFLDNNFVAKSALKAVSPGEEFSVGLGADAAVRVDYRPAIDFHQEQGLLSKSAVDTHSQHVELKNTRLAETVRVRLVQQIPLSTDQKIKVHLLKPELNKEARLTKDNLLEWDLIVAGGQTKAVEIKYTVEHPANEQVQMSEA